MYRPISLLGLLLLLGVVVNAQDCAAETHYDGQPVAHWRARLADSDAKVRRRAAYALGQMGPAAAPAVPELSTALADRQVEVAWYAADALGRIGPAAVPAVKSLIEVIEETPGEPVLRRNSVIALGRIGPQAKAALPVLEKQVQSSDVETRVAAGVTLFQITGEPKGLRLVAAELKPAGGAGSLAAALALRGTAESSEIIEALTGVLSSRNADLRRAASETLGQAGAKAVGPVVAVLQTSEATTLSTRLAALSALGQIARTMNGKLRRELDADGLQRGAQEEIFAWELLVKTLVAELAHPDDTIQSAAALALAQAGRWAVPGLLKALLGSEARAAKGAQLAIDRVGANLSPPSLTADDRDLMPVFTQALAHQDPGVRAAGFRLFVQLQASEASDATVAALKAGLSDPNAQIRRDAAAALARLERSE